MQRGRVRIRDAYTPTVQLSTYGVFAGLASLQYCCVNSTRTCLSTPGRRKLGGRSPESAPSSIVCLVRQNIPHQALRGGGDPWCHEADNRAIPLRRLKRRRDGCEWRARAQVFSTCHHRAGDNTPRIRTRDHSDVMCGAAPGRLSRRPGGGRWGSLGGAVPRLATAEHEQGVLASATPSRRLTWCGMLRSAPPTSVARAMT